MAEQAAPESTTSGGEGWRPADVFISYKREEKEEVARLAEALRGLGLNVWFDARLQSGDSFDAEIDREVNGASCVLVCWSPGAIESHWVRSESSVGFSRGRLVAAILEPVARIPVPFNTVHAESLADWKGEAEHYGWRRILEAVGDKVGRPGLGAWALARGAPSLQTRRDFVRSFPNDPAAPGVFKEIEAGERRTFESALLDAQSKFEGQSAQRRSRFDAEVARLRAEFETWVAAEREGRDAPKPDPAKLQIETPVAQPQSPMIRGFGAFEKVAPVAASWAQALNDKARLAIVGAAAGGIVLGWLVGFPMGNGAGYKRGYAANETYSATPASDSSQTTTDSSTSASSIDQSSSYTVAGDWKLTGGSCSPYLTLSFSEDGTKLRFVSKSAEGIQANDVYEPIAAGSTAGNVSTEPSSGRYTYALESGGLKYTTSNLPEPCYFSRQEPAVH